MRTFVLALVLVFGTGFVWADIEIGVGVSPPMISQQELDAERDQLTTQKSFLGDTVVSFHAALDFSWLLTVSGDAFVLPPIVVRNMTTYVTDGGFLKDGVYRPGFLILTDVGLKLKWGAFGALATAGFNELYIYRQDDLDPDAKPPSLGVNLRLGAFWRLSRDFLVSLTGTSVFPNPESLLSTLKAVAGDNGYLRDEALRTITGNLYPTLGFAFVLGDPEVPR